MGRKSVDEIIESNLQQVIAMLKEGCKDKEIIEFLGISRSAWKAKKNSNTELKKAIDEALDFRNEEIEEAVFKTAKGYHYYEEVITKVKEEYEGSQGQVLVREVVKISNVKKYKGPELAAQKFWLTNRKAAKWKEDMHKVKNDRELLKLKKKELEMKEL